MFVKRYILILHQKYSIYSLINALLRIRHFLPDYQLLLHIDRRISDESSLLVMDIVVELEDGSIANLEMQKIGYAFPGQRSACYSADLLLRQYKRVRGAKAYGKRFNYRDIKDVYTIILFEKSPKAFHAYPEEYYHFFEQKSNTGLEMELLQKYLFVPLDIFTQNRQNKDRYSKREAWLTLFSSDDPDTIIKLVEDYPEFKAIYEEGYQICLNVEKVMDMFSEELYELDRNTVQYMIDEMQDELDATQTQLDAVHTELDTVHTKLDTVYTELNEMSVKYEQSVKNTVTVLRDTGLSEQEIMDKICVLYQFDEKQARKYL